MPIERLTAEDQFMLWPENLRPRDRALLVLDGSNLLDSMGCLRTTL
jgi:hypothetical protein